MAENEPALLTPGTLVRYLETTSRWYFAVVRVARPNEITIELSWDERKKVRPDQVQPFAEFMAARTKSLPGSESIVICEGDRTAATARQLVKRCASPWA